MTIYDRNFGLVAGHRSPIYNTMPYIEKLKWGVYLKKQGNPAFSYRTGFHCNILLYYHYIIASTVLLFLKKFLLLL